MAIPVFGRDRTRLTDRLAFVVLFGTYRELDFVEDAEYLSPRLHHVAASIE